MENCVSPLSVQFVPSGQAFTGLTLIKIYNYIRYFRRLV